MLRTKKAFTVVGAGVLALSLGACGGGSGYCDAIEEAQDKYSDIDQVNPTDKDALNDVKKTFEDIAAEAPSDIKGDWETMVKAFDAFAKIDPSDPESVDQSALGDIQSASDNIEKNVKDECDIDLSKS